jgi:hypothetical protein
VPAKASLGNYKVVCFISFETLCHLRHHADSKQVIVILGGPLNNDGTFVPLIGASIDKD